MVAKPRRLGLSGYFKRGSASSRFFVQGKGAIQLSSRDFKAQGGEGAIFVKGSTAYKIYSDPQKTISPEKIQELSALTEPNIIRPLELLLDGKNRQIGYSMRYAGQSLLLCQLFPRAFRQRHNLTPDVTLQLVRKLQNGVRRVHSNGILIVDLNDLNFLVAEYFRELYFIDVDSYQTPSFPATVLMESVRDRQAQTFTTGSDWFSFAVVSFQMLVGIHPFKGTYAPFDNLSDKAKKLDERMRANISVLHTGVSVPATCLPFSVIPRAYLDWYNAVFETGKRIAPPESLTTRIEALLLPPAAWA
jgi:DNA-binding helix-hairpin-helix protein with protein kinase domain